MPPLPTPAADVLVDGQKVDDKFMEQLFELQVRDNLLLPDTAVVRMRDPDGSYIDSHPFQPGKKLEIRMGARGDSGVTSVFKGDIVALEPEFTEGNCVIAARAYDRSYKLNLNRASRTFQNQKAEDMVKTVGRAAGLSPGTVDSTKYVHQFFQQSMETDWQFCWRLAAMNNFEFVVDDTKFHFRKRKTGSPVTKLEWGANLLTFKPRMSGMGQAKSVRVANHDPKARSALVGNAQAPQLVSKTNAANGRNTVVGKLSGGAVVVADRVATTKAEADAVAQSALDRIASSYVEADGKAVGSPKLRAGSTIKTEKVGSFSGEYVLSQTTHTFRGGDQYTTTFVISGRSGHTFSDLVRHGSQPGWGSSLVIGVVTNNNDPDGMGRVRVKFPALGDAIEGWWARVATLNAGKERGIYMLPQVNDEVVCGFEHGDTRRPFVIGSLYTGKEPLPADLKDAKARKAAFGVKSDDKVHIEGKQAMTVRSGEKMTVEVLKTGQNATGNFLLDAKGGIEQKAMQSITQKATQSIQVEANQSVTIKGKASVTVEASGPLKLKGAVVDIEATGPVNVKGAIINLG